MSIVKKRRNMVVYLIVVIIALLGFTYVANADENLYAGGKGTEAEPYLIETAEHLDNVRENMTSHFKLVNDIDLSSYENWEPIGKNLESFQGIFDGNGKTIKNLKMTYTGNRDMDIGLFGVVRSERNIRPVINDVTLENVDVTGYDDVGGLVGRVTYNSYKDGNETKYPVSTLIKNVEVSGQVVQLTSSVNAASGVGLIAGKTEVAELINAKSTGTVRTYFVAGGLVGLAGFKTSISDSYFSGIVDIDRDNAGGLVGKLTQEGSISNSAAEGIVLGRGKLGGLIGWIGDGVITKSYSTSHVKAKDKYDGNGNGVGGLVGAFEWSANPITITNSFATGDVRGENLVGGLIGNADHTTRVTIKNTFASGNVTGTGTGNAVGGLIGSHEKSIENSYSVGKVSKPNGGTSGGLIGTNRGTVTNSYYHNTRSGQDDIGKGEAKSDTEMKNQSTYEKWDFDDVWQLDPNSDYPYPTLQFTEHKPQKSNHGEIVYVKEGALGNGDSWANAIGNVGIALRMAEWDDNIKEIWIAEGTYTPLWRPDKSANDRAQHFQLINGVTVYGGFPKTGTPNLSDRNPEVYETILSGDLYQNDDGSEESKSDNVYHVFKHPADAGINETAVLDGVTISSGNANGPIASSGVHAGGGMHNDAASPTLRNIIFNENYAVFGGALYNKADSKPVLENITIKNNNGGNGGGIYNETSQPILKNATIKGNKANQGAAIYNDKLWTELHLEDGVIENNIANSSGGGIYNNEGTAILKNITFKNNEASVSGGAIISYGSANSDRTMVIQNGLFIGNKANTTGGALNLLDKGNYNFTNVTIVDNNANDHGAGLNASWYNKDKNRTPTISIQNSIIWGNDDENIANLNGAQINIANSIIGDSGGSDNWDDAIGTDVGNNLDENPLFVGNGDYTLQAESPAIDAGNNEYILAGVTTDLAGNERIAHGTVDMGAYEYDGEPIEEARLESISVEPKEITLQLDEGDHPFDVVSEFDLADLEVIAHYSDESTEQVTNIFSGLGDPSIVDFADDKIVAKSVGETELFINYEGKFAEVDIEVIAAPKLEMIVMGTMGQEFLQVDERRSLSGYDRTITAEYENAPDGSLPIILGLNDLTFTSNNPSIAKVEDNHIVGVYPGETEVNVSYKGKEAQIDVTVANKLYFIENAYEVSIDDMVETGLSLLTPEGKKSVESGKVNYFSHDKDIATIDENGTITGKKIGIAKITATLKGDLGITTEVFVQVTKSEKVDSKASKISLSDAIIELDEGSVKEETTIKVRPVVEEEKEARTPGRWERRKYAGSVYRFTKSKADEPTDPSDPTEPSYFEKPITLTFNFDNKTYTEDNSDVSIHWYDEKNSEWVELDDTVVDWNQGIVSGTINHFTLFTVLAKEFANKEHLSERIEEAEVIDSESYTEDSYTIMTTFLGIAKDIFNKEQPTQEEVDIALANLETAMESLVEIEQVDKVELESVITIAKGLKSENYTDESFKDLENAISASEGVLEKDEATQQEVNEQLANLRKVMNQLEPSSELGSEEVAKDILEIQLVVAKSYKEEDYTADSFEALTNAIEAAESAIEKKDATESEINTALESLQDAIKELKTYEVKREIETETIEFKTIEEEDDTLDKGKTVVIQEGKDGKTIITYEVPYTDGKAGERSQVSKKIINPINEIRYIGTKEQEEGEPPIVTPDPDEKDPDEKDPKEDESDPSDSDQSQDPEKESPEETDSRKIDVTLDEETEVSAGDIVIIKVDGTNTTITMPEDLPAGTKIVVNDARKNDQVKNAVQLVVAGDVFDISIYGPNSDKIDGPFILTMSYDNETYTKDDEVVIYYFDESEGKWERQGGTVDAEAGTITLEVEHFSMYGVFADATTHDTETKPEEQKPDSGKSDPKVTVETDETDTKASQDGSDGEDEKGKSLPKSATNTFNLLIAGAVLLVIGGMLFLFIRRKTLQ